MDGVILNLAGTTTWSDTNDITLDDGAVINNVGTFNVHNDQSLVDGTGADSIFNNSGTLVKSLATGTTARPRHPAEEHADTTAHLREPADSVLIGVFFRKASGRPPDSSGLGRGRTRPQSLRLTTKEGDRGRSWDCLSYCRWVF